MKPLMNKVLPEPLLGAGVGGISYNCCKHVGVIEVAQDAGAPEVASAFDAAEAVFP